MTHRQSLRSTPPPLMKPATPALLHTRLHPTEALEGRVAQPVDGVGVGHVGGHRNDVDAAALHALGRLVEPRDFYVREHDVHPCVCEAFGKGAAHAASPRR